MGQKAKQELRCTFNAAVRIEAREERLTEHAGAPALGELDGRLGFTRWPATRVEDHRGPPRSTPPPAAPGGGGVAVREGLYGDRSECFPGGGPDLGRSPAGDADPDHPGHDEGAGVQRPLWAVD